MHTVFALLCFVVVIHWLIFPYPSGLLHWHCGNLTIAPVPAKQPCWIWINTSCEFIMNDCITTTKQSTTKPCAYFLGYTVAPSRGAWQRLLLNGPPSTQGFSTIVSKKLSLLNDSLVINQYVIAMIWLDYRCFHTDHGQPFTVWFSWCCVENKELLITDSCFPLDPLYKGWPKMYQRIIKIYVCAI